MSYSLQAITSQHTCSDEDWGNLPESCPACQEIASHPCDLCGFGHCFTTHSDICHADDQQMPDGYGEDNSAECHEWATSAHVKID